jgi:outer membrane immunogenic protein
MKKYFSTIVAIALSAGAAMAADLPARNDAPVYAPPPPAFSWTGFYVGANIGGGWLDAYNRTGWGNVWNGIVWVPTYVVANGGAGGGVVGGIQAGYNFQLTPMFVVGLEADFQGSGIGGNGNGAWGGFTRRVDDFGTVRGRVGVTFPGWSQLLVYGTGGFAYGDVSLNQGWLGSLHGGAIGWTAGGGVEYAILPNWSVKGEYLFNNIGGERWGGANLGQQRVHFHTVRAGVNYRFNWGAAAPVMAAF